MADCLLQLRDFISHGKDVVLIGEDGVPTTDMPKAQFIQFGDTRIPKSTPTRYKDNTNLDSSKQEYYTLETVYFAFLKKDALHSEYFHESLKTGIKAVTLIDKRDLFDWLTGKSDRSPNVDEPTLLPSGDAKGECVGIPMGIVSFSKRLFFLLRFQRASGTRSTMQPKTETIKSQS
jgi:hypothetical protein